MADIFTNLTFYASAVDGVRTPVSRNFENPDVPDDPGGGVVENPDPGGPGGGTPTGGDIGNVDGSGTSTLGPAPTITRKTHSQDIFVTAGGVMSITYVVTEDATLLPKRPRADMTVSHSDNGREMTISWNVPANEPGDSTYVGVEAWKYGADTEEAVSTLWDRLHIGKVAGDLKYIGIGTAYPILQPGIERTDISAGDTIIITDNNDANPTYNDFYDVLNVGYWGATSGQVANYITPNGVSTSYTTVNVIGDDGVTVTGTENIRRVDKFTTIMPETPLGAILDREHNRRGCTLYGNYRGRNGQREVYGIKIKGIALRHTPDQFSIEGADECAFEFCSMVKDTTAENYVQTGSQTWYFGNGASWRHQAARNSYYESCMSIGNSRYGAINGRTPMWGESATKHCAFRKMIHTTACARPYDQRIVAGFNHYGARANDRVNLLNVDSAFFEAGYRDRYITKPEPPATGQDFQPAEHSSFVMVNQSGDDGYDEGLISLNTTTNGYRTETSSRSGGIEYMIRSTLKNSVFWDKKGTTGSRPHIEANRIDISNCTLGKNAYVDSNVESCMWNQTLAHASNMLMISGAWDYSYSSTDKTVLSNATSDDSDWCIIPPSAHSSQTTASLSGDLTLIESSNAKAAGAHYISRTEENSTLRDANLGCPNVFAQIGVGGHFKLSGDRDRYDGISNQYVNWLAEIPWKEFRRERQEYDCLANGLQFTGAVGMGKTGVHPTDYINRFGTTPLNPLNCPYIDSIYGKDLPTPGEAIIWWRPVSPAYRSTITGYDVYVDGVKITSTPLAKDKINFTFTGINSGTRAFNVVVRDSTHGNSGFSTTILITVT